MSEDRYIDITSVDGQAALLAQTQQAISDIGATSATSSDDSVCVWVDVNGAVLNIELEDTTRRLDADELARLITATAQEAARNAAQRVARVLLEVDQRRSEMLQEISELDPEIADILRTIANRNRPDTTPPTNPFSFL
ncbi:YbaB/EbfC family nucleoid-associated protein [Mycolicibacterium fluoranthenivorans]|uniref:YbaB/EbfC family nucleoid-associated protein n=1 Tax=Mycolicibacterium fluoranthenivorans TaxID=258505 RepID=A0A7G8PKJ4_9MYCO|nr:YbaB/EbfC family nucleoid-associated protein [Mycolicibacterium fluoranthenivorans]QNJ94860.1 YbaB/EbfC family nucleoid-associated protein [Mycolicibacterium fluoranthenivorans]